MAQAALIFLSCFLCLIPLSLSFRDCRSRTLRTIPYPATSLSVLNPYLSSSVPFQSLPSPPCPSRPAGQVCPDLPGMGSGLAQVGPNSFIALTDRGPNQDCEDLFATDPVLYPAAEGKDGKGFPVPGFSPTFAYFDVVDNEIQPTKYVHLRNTKGRRVSGVSNTERDDIPYGPDCRKRLELDPAGVDPEDIALIPGSKYVAIVEEYSPSVLVVHAQSGKIAGRYVPKSLEIELAGAGYPIIGELPDVYLNRRKNRGFEGIVVDEAGTYVIAILQSPMVGDGGDANDNRIIRCAVLDITMSSDGVPTLKYRMSFVLEASPVRAYVNPANVPKDMKYSGAQYATEGKFVALERAKGQVKLFLVDWSAATNIDETEFANNLGLEVGTNGALTSNQLGVQPARKTLIWDSAKGVGGSVGWDGPSKQEGFVVDMLNQTRVWMINDNDFGLGSSAVELREIELGRNVSGATVCGIPPHPPSPRVEVIPSKQIRLENPSTLRVSDVPGGGAAENLDVDEANLRVYVANDESMTLDMFNATTSPVVFMSSYSAEGFAPTSVSVCPTNNLIAIALANANGEELPGRIDVVTKDFKRTVRSFENGNCFLPDHVTWSDDCKFLVAACEGEGATIPGGIFVADFGGSPKDPIRGARVVTFNAFDEMAMTVLDNGIRLVESNIPSLDFEPEYVTVVGNHAFVTLQENNGIAVVDLLEAQITELKPLGYIDRSRPGFGIDASDKDGVINIRNYDFLYGMPQPDTISKFVAGDGKTYLVYANEGDAKDAEEARGKDITDPEGLGRIAAPGLKELVEDDELLGRLEFSTIMGYNSTSNVQEKMFHFGSRSFSIMSLDGKIVYDSGELFARIQESLFPTIFNSNGFESDNLMESQEDQFDKR